MASKAATAAARDAVRVIIVEQTPAGPRARFSLPANMEHVDLIAEARAEILRARSGNTVTVSTVTMAIA